LWQLRAFERAIALLVEVDESCSVVRRLGAGCAALRLIR
jgi:hypothetical protein